MFYGNHTNTQNLQQIHKRERKKLKHITVGNHQAAKKERKGRSKGTIKQLENSQEDGISKPIRINNYFNWLSIVQNSD